MNLERIASVAAQECIRQQVGLDRVAMLLDTYYKVYEHRANWGKLDLPIIRWMGGNLEPSNHGHLRSVPVTFRNGGTSSHPSEIKSRLETLLRQTHLPVDEWVKEFLWIHPFTDGNGRTAWLLRTWMLGQWNNPENLPDYGWD